MYSKIAKRICKKLTFIYTILYILLFFFLIIVLIPILYKNTIHSKLSMQDIFVEEYAALQAQLSETFNSLSSSFFDQVNEYEKNPTRANEASLVQELSSYIDSHSNYASIGLQFSNGEYVSSFYHRYIPQETLLNNNVHYQQLRNGSISSYFSPIYEDAILKAATPETNYYDMLYYSKNYSHGAQTYTFTIFYNVNNALKKNNALNAASFDDYLILDRYGDIIYTTNTAFSDTFIEQCFPEQTTYRSASDFFSFQNGLCFYREIPSTGWLIVSYISYFRIMEQIFLIIGIIAFLYMASPLMYALFLVPIIRKQLSPLKTLSDTMLSYTAGQNVSLEIHTDDEIEDLSNTFNQMILKINQQVENIRKQEHENSVVNYKLLATQIDPHFIYNTMNIINIMARQGNRQAVIEVNTALVRILRERLNSKLSIYDTLRNEYNSMLQYGIIMDYRYSHQIEIHYDIANDLMDVKIPKNILQPLVENSFYHGFGVMEPAKSGHIDVLIYSIEEELVMEVSDDGQGMSAERLQEILNQSYSIYEDNKPHIGINNIRQRLYFIYEDQYKMEIHSTPALGTTIIITIPLSIPEEFLLKK